MKKVKKIAKIVLSLILCVGILQPLSIQAAEVSVGDFTYDLNEEEKTATVKEYIGSDTSVSVPSSVAHEGSMYTVIEIDYRVFRNNTTITKVIIPDTITFIESESFENCTNLTNVTIPDSVTEIEYSAFKGCTSLTSITLPDSVTVIGNYVFENSGLTSIVLPNSVTRTGQNLFKGCTDLVSVTLSNSLTKIASYSFENCTSLESVIIPNNITEIENDVFRNCTNLTTVTLSNQLQKINSSTFYNCKKLSNITIPEGVTEIASYAFSYCDAITSMTFPSTLKIIGQQAFLYCSNLTEVIIPEGVTRIGLDAFQYSGLTSVTIPGSAKELFQYAFANCTNLTSATVYHDAIKVKVNNEPPVDYANVFEDTPALTNNNITHILVNPTQLNWNVKQALWKDIESADAYEVQLYKDGLALGGVVTVHDAKYDFSDVIREAGRYHFTVKALSNVYTDSEIVTSPTTNIYEVTFDTQGKGATPEKQLVVENDTVTKPTGLVSTGYLLEEWFKDQGMTTPFNIGTDVVTSNLTLYAKWVKCDHDNNTNEGPCDETVKCSECEEEIKGSNHTFTWIVDKKPTVNEEGLKHEECEGCHVKRNVDTSISKVVDTGDNTNIFLWMFMLVSSLGVLLSKKRTN